MTTWMKPEPLLKATGMKKKEIKAIEKKLRDVSTIEEALSVVPGVPAGIQDALIAKAPITKGVVAQAYAYDNLVLQLEQLAGETVE